MSKKTKKCFILGAIFLLVGLIFLVFGNADIAKTLIIVSVILNTTGFLLKNKEK